MAAAASSAHIADKFRQARTHRVPLLTVLLSNVPPGTIQYGRKVAGHQLTDTGVRLEFDDSDSQMFDLVVAADGLYSVSYPVYCSVLDFLTMARNSEEHLFRTR